MLSDVIVNDQWWWGGWDCLLSYHVMGTIEVMQIRLSPSVQDTPVWTANEKGVVSVASAWNIFRKVKRQSWIDSKTWQKQVPFKMCFTVWRALRERLLTDARVLRMGFSSTSRCCCCINPVNETIDHLFCSGSFAQNIWRIMCGAN